MEEGITSLLDGLACLTWRQDGTGLWPHLVTAESPLSHSSEAPGARGKSTYSTAAALQRGFAWTRHSWSAGKQACEQQVPRAWTGIGHGRQCLAHKWTEGVGRGPSKCMSCIIQGLTELFRLNQAQNKTKIDLAGQQSLHLWTNTNYFDQHVVKMWIDCCHLWKHSSVALVTPSDQLFR